MDKKTIKTLSDKKKSTFEDIEYLRNNDNVNFYYDDDVKQFIKDLKKELNCSNSVIGVYETINELAGEDLI